MEKYVDHTEKPPTLLSLCTGYGGLEIGIEKAIGPVTPVACVEIEAFADTNLVNKMETNRMVPVPIWTNLKTFHAYAFRDKVDILTGGYPCQPFSAAGKRKGKDDPRHLWPWVREVIKAVRPGLCFFENVEGHISLGLREVLTDLVKLGYSVENDCGEPTWGLFSAAEVGAPHQRKRVFIMAYSQHSVRWNAKDWLQYQTEWSSCPRKIRTPSSLSKEKLADSRSPEPNRISESEEWQQNREIGNAGFELGNSSSNNQRRSSIPTMHRERVKAGGSSSELANTHSSIKQECRVKRAFQQKTEYPCTTITRSRNQWPARPGQEQYKWEEPRTVANTQLPWAPSNRCNVGMGRKKEQQVSGPWGTQIETEPQLGGTIDGTRDRVDRLRLCGNGVMPDQAEKAFITLMNRILNPGSVQPSIQMELF